MADKLLYVQPDARWINMTYGNISFKVDNKFAVQDAQLSQRDRAAGCVIVFAKCRRLELGDNILRTV